MPDYYILLSVHSISYILTVTWNIHYGEHINHRIFKEHTKICIGQIKYIKKTGSLILITLIEKFKKFIPNKF